MRKKIMPHVWFWLSLVLLRWQLATEFHFDLKQAFAVGFWIGCLLDAMVVTGAFSVSQLMTGMPMRIVWLMLALFGWLSSLANVLHFRFFHTFLDWWIVEHHIGDVWIDRGSAATLGALPLIYASIACIVLSIVTFFIYKPVPQKRWRTLAITAVSTILLWCVPIWFGVNYVGAGMKDQVLRTWLLQNFREGIYAGAGLSWSEELTQGLSVEDQKTPTRMLLAFHEFNDKELPEISQEPWPLARPFAPDAQATETLRKRMGFTSDKPLNVIVLMVESLRAFEMLEPTLGPKIFPRLQKTLEKNAILFTQAYSSSLTAGQTVRGHFSTFCSMLPNMTGAAEYIAHPSVNTKCLAQFFKNQGYQTIWMNPYRDSFHNKRLFESLHGIDLFYDQTFYKAQGVTHKLDAWGFADKPFLQESLNQLLRLAKENKPLFANISTTSTHHPYHYTEEGALSEELLEATKNHLNYRGYLSRLHYADGAIADFIEGIFNSEIGENTVIVMLGDHSVHELPYHALTPVQTQELSTRIVLSFLSKHMPQPTRLASQVHQVDVAPTIATLSGFKEDSVTWVGNNMFVKGTPFVFSQEKNLSYRTQKRACYTLDSKIHCYNTEKIDPLFAQLTEIPENQSISEFFRRVVQANRLAIVFNRIAPSSMN